MSLLTSTNALLSSITQQPANAFGGVLTGLIPNSPGPGFGAVLTIVITVNVVTEVTVTSPGSKYKAGDTLTVSIDQIPNATLPLIFTIQSGNIEILPQNRWQYRNKVPPINLLTPCQPPNLVQFSREWNFYLDPIQQQHESGGPMTDAELAAYDKSLAPSLNQLRIDSSIQNFSQITVSRKTVATDDQNSAFTSTPSGSLTNDSTSTPPGFNNSQFGPNPLPGASNGVYNTTPTTDGAGSGAVLTVTITGGTGNVQTVVVTSGGSGYAIGDVLTIPAAQIGGATADLIVFIGNNNVSVPVNIASIGNNGEYIPTVLQTQSDVSLAAPALIKPPVDGVAQLSLLDSSAGLLTATTNGLLPSAATLNLGNPVTNTFVNIPLVTASGVGSGGIVNIRLLLGVVTDVAVVSPGSGYQIGDVVFVLAATLGTVSDLVFTLLSSALAQVLIDGGYGFPTGFTRQIETKALTGCGVDLTVSINASTPEGSITDLTICDQGKEYKTGDVIEVINPNEGQLSTNTGALLASITSQVTGATINTWPGIPFITIVGSGSGAIATFIVSAANLVSGIVITNPGSGYKIGDELTIQFASLGVGSAGPVLKLKFGSVDSNAKISIDILAPAPLAVTQPNGFIQMDQGGFQLPSGAWGAYLGVVSLSYTGGSINGTTQSRIVVETCEPHGLNSGDKVDINGVDLFRNSNNFEVIGIHDVNKFEINNPYQYGVLPVGPALNAFVKPYRQKSSIDQAGLTVPYRNTVSKTIQKQVFPTTTLFACAGPQGPTHTGCNNQNYDFSNVNGKTGANGVPAQSIYNDPPPILQPVNFRGPVATSFGVSKQLNASELAMLQLNSVPFPL